MPAYKYIVKSGDGQTVEGRMEGENEGEVINQLRSKGLLIVEVSKASQVKVTKSHKKISSDDLVTFTRQMATMIDAGLPLLQALRIMSEQLDNINFRIVVNEISDDIEGGASFSDALVKHPKAFDGLYCAMIRVGEASGMFAEILNKVATYLEEASRLKRKVKSALIYPTVVSGMAFLITTLLLIKVVPVFKEIFEGFGAELPAATQVVVDISDILRHYFLAVFLGFVMIIIAIRMIYKTEGGRFFFDKMQFKLPIFGDILKKAALSRFTKTLGTLVASGVPMIQSLEIVQTVVGNATLEYALKSATKKILAGEGISPPLAETKVFPPMVTRMVDVGEKTGKLDLMLQKISEFYDDQVNNAVSALTSLIEPLLIAFLGIVVGGIVIAMFMPIFKLSSIVN
ncbi:MAG: type II secretion system F family protein [Candidatus Aureabacteria bacterium]|nr:type II secretion system F family protein [Candidatus Auribacterota bacterium]